jgi:ketosteroid isomerase-like protein
MVGCVPVSGEADGGDFAMVRKGMIRTTWWSFLVLAALAAALGGPTAVAADDAKAVMDAAAQFYRALNVMFTGEVAPMLEVWSHARDVTYMGPGGDFRVGWDQVLASWKEQAAMKLGGQVRPENMRVVVGRDLAVTHNVEVGENITDGKVSKVSIRATNVFRKEAGKWKMVGHHTDLLPHLKP